MTLVESRAIAGAIGCGEFTAFVTGRGGSPVRFELEHSSLSINKVLNAAGQARLSLPNDAASIASCCEALRDSEPWRDELLIYRDGEVAYVGPLVGVRASDDGGEFNSTDLFSWMDQRFIEQDVFKDGDAADVFREVFETAYDKDDSPNISISTRSTGVDVVRSYKGKEFHRAADVLRELARTGVDFTMDGRRLLVGGLEVLFDTTPIILHDDGVLSAEVTREGVNFATDVAVFGATLRAGGDPVTGRAIRASERYGLVQKSFTELQIKDRTSADANALAHVEAMQPAPLRVTATLSQNAAFAFSDLICGRRVDVRFAQATCIPVMEVMRLVSVRIDANASEQENSEAVTLDMVPLGVTEVA